MSRYIFFFWLASSQPIFFLYWQRIFVFLDQNILRKVKKFPWSLYPLQKKKELLLETLWAWSYFFFFHNNLLCIMLFYYFMILGSNVTTTKYFQMGHSLFLFLINPTIIEQLPIIQNKQKYCYWQLGENSK